MLRIGSGIRILAAGIAGAGIDGNVADTGLVCQGIDRQAVCRCIQLHGNGQVLHRHGQTAQGAQRIGQCRHTVSVGNIENDGLHVGVRNDQLAALIETGRICVVGNIIGGACFVVGHGDAVLLPDLRVGVVGGTVCLISKADGDTLAGGLVGSLAALIAAGAAALLHAVDGDDPAVLDLGSAAVLTHNTVDGNGVANHRLGGHCIKAVSAVGRVGAVDGQGIAGIIGDIHVAIGGLVDLRDLSGDLILDGGVGVVRHGSALLIGLHDGQHGAIGIGLLGSLDRGRLGQLGAAGNELSHKLGLTHGGSVAVGDVVGAGGRDGVEGAVGTQVELAACVLYGIGLRILIICKVSAGAGCQAGVGLAGVGVAGDDLHISLGVALHKEEANTLAVDLLHVDIHSVSRIFGGCQVVAAGLSVEVQVLADGILRHSQVVRSILLQRTVIDRHNTAALFPAIQATAGAKLQLAVVVLDDTGNGDLIGDTHIGSMLALHAVALDLHAVYLDGNGDIAVAGIVGTIHADDLTGQRSAVGQLLAFLQSLGIP